MNHANGHSTARNRGVSWAWLRRLRGKQTRLDFRWRSINALKDKAEGALAPYHGRYQHLLHRWKQRLRPICGELFEVAWADFRPLRLSREEAWSDMLAWLLEAATTGILGRLMFGAHTNHNSACFRTRNVEREVQTKNQERRADIVVTWRSGQRTHIEVKVGDKNFDKTFETCRKLHAAIPTCVWSDAILMPDGSRAAWEKAARSNVGESTVEVILWDDVARYLRRCLWERREPAAWQAWAWTFCGAIEADLLGLRSPDGLPLGISRLQMASRWVEVLTSGAGEEL